MDIELLSKMVKELILDNDNVILPGFGMFVAEVVPSSFSDRGYTINPPYRKIYFRTRSDDDDALARLYASSNSVDVAVASKIITDFVIELKSVLKQQKVVIFPGLGRMRATKENNFFFVADENLDIYPEGFGLEPISLKSHEQTEENLAAAIVDIAEIMNSNPIPLQGDVIAEDSVKKVDVQPVVDTAAEKTAASAEAEGTEVDVAVEPSAEAAETEGTEVNVVVEPSTEDSDVVTDVEAEAAKVQSAAEATAAETEGTEVDVAVEPSAEANLAVEEPVVEEVASNEVVPNQVVTDEKNYVDSGSENQDHQKNKTWRIMLIVFGSVAGLAAIALALFLLLARLNPEFIDRILYSEEELELLHYKE